MSDNLIASIFELSPGKFGVKYDDEILELFTQESHPFEETKMRKIGQIDCAMTGLFHPHHVPDKLIEMYPDGGDLAFYLLGDTSRQSKLTYIPIHESMLMGYEIASKSSSFGYIYYFAKCGEINGVPVYSYTSDMLIESKEMKWVSSQDTFSVPHSRSEK